MMRGGQPRTRSVRDACDGGREKRRPGRPYGAGSSLLGGKAAGRFLEVVRHFAHRLHLNKKTIAKTRPGTPVTAPIPKCIRAGSPSSPQRTG